MESEKVINIIILATVSTLFYFVAIAPRLRERLLLKNGVRLVAEVANASKTILKRGTGGFAVPIWELKVSYIYEGVNYSVYKKHDVPKGYTLPKSGDKLAIILNPKKPRDIMILKR